MPRFNLLFSDPALRDAVQEQLKSFADSACVALSAIDEMLDDANAVLVVDANASLDKKVRKRLQELRKATTPVPVFLLGAAREDDAALFAESFALPVRLGHFLARLRFHLEAAPRMRGKVIAFGPYKLEPQNRQITFAPEGGVIRLTEKETALLEYLGQSEKPVPRDELLAAIWGYVSAIETHTLETHIYQLRRKLDPHNKGENWLVNEQGAYRLVRT